MFVTHKGHCASVSGLNCEGFSLSVQLLNLIEGRIALVAVLILEMRVIGSNLSQK